MTTYKITRKYFNSRKFDEEIIATGLTLDDAKAHCKNPETSSRTCEEPNNVERTSLCGLGSIVLTRNK